MKGNLRVFYGWAKLGKVRKREAISVIFENEALKEEKARRTVSMAQDTAYIRNQTDGEMKDSAGCNRCFTEFSIFLDDAYIKGDLDTALRINNEADKNNVQEKIRNDIETALRRMYCAKHPDYKEPFERQLEINFN